MVAWFNHECTLDPNRVYRERSTCITAIYPGCNKQNHTCRSLMYQVRLAAGLLRPHVQFKRNTSLIRYLLLNPCIDGSWEGNSAEQETSGTHTSGNMRSMFETPPLTFERSVRRCYMLRDIYIYIRVFVRDIRGREALGGGLEVFKIPGCTGVSPILARWWKILLLCLAIRARPPHRVSILE